MLTEFERPMTEGERERLLSQLPARRPVTFQWVGPRRGEAAVLALVFSVLAVTWKPILAGLSAVLYVVLFVLPAFVKEFLRVRRGNPTANLRQDRARHAVAAASTVSVQRVESRAVAEVLGDDVTIYLFDLGDGRVFWHGIMPDEKVDPARWPSSCFELLKIPRSQELFGPFCEGERLTPRESLENVDLGDLLESGVIDRSLEALLQSLRQKGAAG